MRISDVSSDVCSSDLELQGVDQAQYRQRVIEERVPALKRLIDHYRPRAVIFHGKAGWRDYGVREVFGVTLDDRRIADYPEHGLIFTNFFSRRFEIGGALCRERVCQYV